MGYREDFLAVLAGKMPEKFPLTEYMYFWPETVEGYKLQTKTRDLAEYFGLGIRYNIPYNFNPYPAFIEEIIEETASRIIKKDAIGVTLMLEKGTSAMPHYIDFPIKDRKTFEELSRRLDPLAPERFTAIPEYDKFIKKTGGLSELVCRGPFAFLRDFIKFDELMMLFSDEPELIRDMTEFHCDFLIKSWSEVFKRHIPDMCYLGEDMAYKNGSMISPAMIEDFIYPVWKKVISFVKSCGVKFVILDSDGNINDILPIAVRAGFNVVLPIERAAGMDAEKVRHSFPQLAVIGGVDKLELAKGKAEIDREALKAAQL